MEYCSLTLLNALDKRGSTNPDGTLTSDVVAYVRALSHGDQSDAAGHLDLQFWFFYPYNGCGSLDMHMTFEGISAAPLSQFELAPFGEHYGDWECCVIRVDPLDDNPVRGVYLTQHSGGAWFTPGEFHTTPDGRIKIYSSKHGHAIYTAPGTNPSSSFRQDFRIGHVEGVLLNLTEESSVTLDCSQKFQLISTQGQGLPHVTPPRWAQYRYRFGPRSDSQAEAPVDPFFKRLQAEKFWGSVEGFEALALSEAIAATAATAAACYFIPFVGPFIAVGLSATAIAELTALLAGQLHAVQDFIFRQVIANIPEATDQANLSGPRAPCTQDTWNGNYSV